MGPGRRRQDDLGDQGQDAQPLAAGLPVERQPVAGQGLARDDPADVQREIRGPRQASGLVVQVGHLEQPAPRLAAGVLARHPIEPALDAARQAEIERVDGQDERAVDDAAIEPVGQDDLHALDPAVAQRPFFPFVDPGELLAAPMLALTDRGGHHGRLQAHQRGLEPAIVGGPGLAADGGQQLVGRKAQAAGGAKAPVLGLDDLRGGPDQEVGVPDRGHAVLGQAVDLHLDRAGPIEDGTGSPRLRQREERTLHQVALVAGTGVAAGDDERVEPLGLAGREGGLAGHGQAWLPAAASAPSC